MKIPAILDRLNFIADTFHDGYSPDEYSDEEYERMTEESAQLLKKLSRSGSAGTLSVLIRYLNANHSEVRDIAFALLNKKDPQKVVQVLASLLASDQSKALKKLTMCLRHFAGEVEGGIVIGRKLLKKPLLPDSNPLAAAINHSLTDRLIELSKRPEWFIRANCLCVLGYIGMDAERIVPVLEAGERDDNENVSEDANYALKVFRETQKALAASGLG